jgi:opine dehydrogenase
MTTQKVAIVGGGPIGRATAAFLAHHAHQAGIWSPTGRSTASLARVPGDTGRVWLSYEGALSGREAVTRIGDAKTLADYPIVVIAVPGHAYPSVLPVVVQSLRGDQLVIVSGALSLAPLWIRDRMAERNQAPVVAAWGTTLATARASQSADVKINTIRARFDVAAVPAAAGDSVLATCSNLFGDRFSLADNLLGVALSNVNPIAHAAETLPNLTRIDRAEDWPLFHYLTPAAARICSALDRERLEIARAFGLTVRSIEEHYELSYHVPRGEIAQIAEAIHAKYQGPLGPKTLEHRYVLEDVPYGLVFYETLARCAGVDAENISASIALLSSACGRDFRRDNSLLADLALEGARPAEILERCRTG